MIYTCPAGDDHHASPTTVYRWHQLSNRSFEGAVAAMARKAQAHDDFMAGMEALRASEYYRAMMDSDPAARTAIGYRLAMKDIDRFTQDASRNREQQLQEKDEL